VEGVSSSESSPLKHLVKKNQNLVRHDGFYLPLVCMGSLGKSECS
jgi:hypothetical protein